MGSYCSPCFKIVAPSDEPFVIIGHEFKNTIKVPRSVSHKVMKDQDVPRKRRVKTDKIADEQKLAAIMPTLKSGDSWYEEAVTVLNADNPSDTWDKARVMFTYRRLKLQGIKKQTTAELLRSLLTTTPQTVGEIAGQTFLDYHWAYQVLRKMATKDKKIKVARSNDNNKLMYYI